MGTPLALELDPNDWRAHALELIKTQAGQFTAEDLYDQGLPEGQPGWIQSVLGTASRAGIITRTGWQATSRRPARRRGHLTVWALTKEDR